MGAVWGVFPSIGYWRPEGRDSITSGRNEVSHIKVDGQAGCRLRTMPPAGAWSRAGMLLRQARRRSVQYRPTFSHWNKYTFPSLLPSIVLSSMFVRPPCYSEQQCFAASRQTDGSRTMRRSHTRETHSYSTCAWFPYLSLREEPGNMYKNKCNSHERITAATRTTYTIVLLKMMTVT